MNYKIRRGHVNLCTCPLFCVLNCCCCCCVASSHNNNISLYIFPNLPLKGLGGRVKPYFLASCQVRFASGVLGVLMDLVLSSFWTSLAPYCIDSTLCRFTCTLRGLAWTPQFLKQRRVAFNWHTFSRGFAGPRLWRSSFNRWMPFWFWLQTPVSYDRLEPRHWHSLPQRVLPLMQSCIYVWGTFSGTGGIFRPREPIVWA
jgi:hypothetical protein